MAGNFRERNPGKSAKTEDGEDWNTVKRLGLIKTNESLDEKFGYEQFNDGVEREGWLVNFEASEIVDEDKRLISAISYYFILTDGSRLKCSQPYAPYFFLITKEGTETEVSAYLAKKYAGVLASVAIVIKEDLDLPNHLMGLTRKLIKLSFLNTNHMMKLKTALMPIVRRNQEKAKSQDAYTSLLSNVLSAQNDGPSGSSGVKTAMGNKSASEKTMEQSENILDVREYDVPYHVRVAIDLNIFVGKWYTVKHVAGKSPELVDHPTLIDWPDPVVLAFDIETTKLPLKFPDSAIDQIMMISYMVDGQGYLIVNREIVSEDVEDFEYTPKPEFEGPFVIFNVVDEQALLQHFFDHVREIRPHVFATYNGDFFDWPFIERRATEYGLDMHHEIGFSKDSQGEYKSRNAIHMDCLCWVKRDSYLPVGSQNLKAVTKAKLRYDPVELDPEEMCQMAREKPQILANYSVSDAVATYYLYMKYVHPFIFALSTIIPMKPDEVLRKGSGTLCEALLMVKAFEINILFPNKQLTELNKMTPGGQVLDNETYVGGHVEALESGVFRSNIPVKFRMVPEAFQKLIGSLDSTLQHALVEEEQIPLENITNYDEIKSKIKKKLEILRDFPSRMENPMIYHLDVGAMYPNIILTNRLQPPALVDETVCATCDFNKPGARCQRKMAWVWRGDVMPASRNEFYKVQYQLETEKFPPLFPGGNPRAYHELTREERAAAEKKRLGEYCRKAYKRTKVTKEEVKYSTVCQRENSFYVDTVRAFRDRRYEFKGLTKVWKKKLTEATNSGDIEAIRSAKSKEILYDSLQLAHKCILNSFYGYVMRKGSRWFSMEMAGIVCHTGANIIKAARELVEQIGRPLELDTDGIWCILPASFPENCVFTTNDPKKPSVSISYPGAMLNVLVQKNFTNNQYHDRVAPEIPEYTIRSENSIFFEVDGPYLAMILPASKEEGKKLKKRYVVFNDDGSIAELKGFEVKRRGELQLIKNFQSSVFDSFLNGVSLEEAYEHAAKVANYWLDVLYSRAANMPDSELFDLIAENRFMSKSLSEYEGQKSTSISTAKRLAEFLGDQMVKDAGLACKFVISRKPENAPVTERAVPLAIFQSDPAVRSFYLKKWLKSPGLNEFDIREILDWQYYVERFSSCIQKIITIPAALQGLSNPVPRVAHPDWLQKRLIEKLDYNKQKRISEIFMPSLGNSTDTKSNKGVKDIESLGGKGNSVPVIRVSKKRKLELENLEALKKPWRELLGNPPEMGESKEALQAWIQFHKKKWAHQIKQRKNRELVEKTSKRQKSSTEDIAAVPQGYGTGSKRGQGLSGGLNTFVRKTQSTLMNTHWQIIQLTKTNSPGLFKAWTLVGNDLHCLKISVPRIFYINMKQPKEQERGHIWKRTQKYLPRAHPTYNLYQYCVPEQNFIEHAQELQVDFTSPNVEGVYELSVPLEFRFLVNIGCVCIINKHVVKTLIGRDTEYFDMQELTEKTLADVTYLEEDNNTHLLKKLFLYQFVISGRGVTALFGTHMSKAYLWIIDPSGTNAIPNLNSMYATEWNLKKNKENVSSDCVPQGGISFESSVCKDADAVNKQLSKILQNYKSEKRGPTIVCYQANTFRYFNKIAVLNNEFPTIDLTVEDPPNLLSGLEWQKMACRWSIKHYLNFLLRYNSLVDHCRYLHIPIGNMPNEDVFNFGADLFFARQLRKHNHLMWLSKTDRPDFGGKEADDHRLASNCFDSHRSVEVIDPGLYKGVCVEMEILSLPIATIVQSHHVNDMEGGAADSISFNLLPQQNIADHMMSSSGQSGSDQQNSVASYDSSVLCTYAFRVLKSMVHSWLKEVSVYRNQWADLQLVHLFRWLTTSASYLHDPALTKIVGVMMQKVLIQLVAEFKRLGADIIYASFNKLIIHTTKHTTTDAQSYIQFISDNIRSRDLFHILDFKPNKFWNILMFMDSCNFGGVICNENSHELEKNSSEDKENQTKEFKGKGGGGVSNEKTTETQGGRRSNNDDSVNVRAIGDLDEDEDTESRIEEGAVMGGDKDDEIEVIEEPNNGDQKTETQENSADDLEIDSNWNLMYYLPLDEADDLQGQFGVVVANYLVLVLKKMQQLRRDHSTMATETVIVDGGEDGKEVMSSFDSTLREFCRNLISSDMTQKIVGVVHALQMKRQKFEFNESDNENKFPLLPGSYLKLTNPELEFIKSVCHVLSLDTSVASQVEQMKKTVLRIINVGEFSDSADFQNPSLSYILREVICKECNYCRDVDLCRDITLDFEGEELGLWKCTECSTPYDVDNIEMSLVSEVQKLSLAFVLQDLSCLKCKNIKQLNMKRTCECSGQFTYLIKRDRFRQQLMTLLNIAKYYKMDYLKETVLWTSREAKKK